MSNKHYLIVGAGLTGYSCVKFLRERGAKVSVFDTRENPPYLDKLKQYFPEVLVSLIELEYDENITDIIISPGISKKHPILKDYIQNNTPIYGDIELFAKYAKAPVVGITGTNGKSTVTAMVGEIAKAANIKVAVGGNIGVPALDLLDDTIELYVLELSSFQLETIDSLKLKIGCILNISEDHLDRYASFADYVAAKERIYDFAEIKIRPNGSNNNDSACTIARALGIADDIITTALSNFKGLEHRCEIVANINGVTWVNDSKGTNVGATVAGITNISQIISGKIILILGGLGKGQDFYPLLDLIKQHCKELILLGESKYELNTIFADNITTNLVDNLAQAVEEARCLAKPRDAVLLSPACASQDMFKNFEERGKIFKSLAKRETICQSEKI